MTAPTPAAARAPDDRRIAPRRQPAMGTVCRLDTPDGPAALALVWNISRSGISMLLNAPRVAGAVLSGYLEVTDGDAMLRVSMTVVHVKPLETGDYFIGAHFERPLTTDELKPFIAE